MFFIYNLKALFYRRSKILSYVKYPEKSWAGVYENVTSASELQGALHSEGKDICKRQNVPLKT